MSIRFIDLIAISIVSAASSGFALMVINVGEALASSSQSFSESMTAMVRQEHNHSLLPPVAKTEQIAQFIPEESLPDAMERVLFNHARVSFEEWQIIDQFNNSLGWYSFPEGSYPENRITLDAELVNIVYQDALKSQALNDLTIRTRDLDNPFNTSLGEEPAYLRSIQPVEERRIIIETVPRR